jgi:multicomponent Na+:H+ antiporter subunit D
MVAATAAMVAVGVLLAVIAGPVWAVSTRAAEDLMDQSAYVATVLQ